MDALPHVTVATVVVQDGRFLLVREQADGAVVYNQPAGHVECGESLLQAAVRETLEETAWRVRLTSLLGIYQFTSAANGISYVRVCFVAEPVSHDPGATLDTGILAAEWLTADEVAALTKNLRSPMVLRAIHDYQHGERYPLSVIQQ